MARGDNIATTVPSVGDSETGGTTDLLTIVTALVAIAETKVTPSEIDMDATLDFNSQAAENVATIEFITQVSSPGNERLYTKNDGATDELYYQNDSGQEVQITNAGALNVAATGSVTGAGYGSGGVEINWNSAGTEYRMKSGSGADDYANVVTSGIEFRDGSSHAVTFTAQGMSSDYTVTLPAALPAAETFVTLDASGNLAVNDASTPFSNFLHDSYNVMVPMVAGENNTNGTWTQAANHQWSSTASGAHSLLVPLTGLKTGDVIKTVEVYVSSNADSDSWTYELQSAGTDGTLSTVSGWTRASTGGTWQNFNGSDHTVVEHETYYVKMSATKSSTGAYTVTALEMTLARE